MILLVETSANPGPVGFDLAKAMLGGALGLFGTIVTLAISWLKDRNTDSIRAKRVEELSKRQTFWKDWCATALPLVPEAQKSELEEQARNQLIVLAEEMQELPPSAPQAP